jgi:hypothetical protein
MFRKQTSLEAIAIHPASAKCFQGKIKEQIYLRDIHLHRSLWLTEQSGLFRPLHTSPAHLATFVGRYTVTEITLILSVATSSSALPYVRRLPLLLLLRHNIDAIADHKSACALRQAALDKVSQDTFKDLLLHHLPSRYVFK